MERLPCRRADVYSAWEQDSANEAFENTLYARTADIDRRHGLRICQTFISFEQDHSPLELACLHHPFACQLDQLLFLFTTLN
jgi:hypothetical protein